MQTSWVQYFQQNSERLWKKDFPIWNLVLVVLTICFNLFSNGLFCVFVPWAMVIQVICLINIVTFTWLENTRFWQLNALICGISACVFFYWIMFLEEWLFFFPVPIWFLFLLIWRNLVHPVRKHIRAWYFMGITICVIASILFTILFSAAAKKVQHEEYDTSNPMTERILGMHFLYHTRACFFDGWRPPLHDPAMVIGMRLIGDKDPLEGMTLESRVALYHKIYPSRPVIARCACTIGSGYFDDILWKSIDFHPMKVYKQVSVYENYAVEWNNGRLSEQDFPMFFIDNTWNRIVVNMKEGSDTIVSGYAGSHFIEVSLVEFDGQQMYRLTCIDSISKQFLEIFVLQNGVQIITEPFDAKGSRYCKYWIAEKSINQMEAVEIFYPEIDIRDTVKLYRRE